jgi:hypothetical protein
VTVIVPPRGKPNINLMLTWRCAGFKLGRGRRYVVVARTTILLIDDELTAVSRMTINMKLRPLITVASFHGENQR